MASSYLNLLFFSFLSILIISKSQVSDSVNGVVLPVFKDVQTGQYVVQIHLGDSLEAIKLVVDLAGSLLWFDCSSGHVSSSRSLISGSSSGCLKAKVANSQISSSSSSGDCEFLVRNDVVGITARGELTGDMLSFGSVSSPGTIDRFLFACAPQWLLRGLASGAQGVMGLGKAQISLPSQLAAETNERELNGVVSTSSVEEVFGVATSRSLVYTPLLTGSSGNYVINVKSIKINGEKLSVEGQLRAEISTVVPYTMLETRMYEIFTEAYGKAAINATKVAYVAPFGLCFTSEVDLPAVDLALQSELVKWRIQGKNLVVDVGGGVQCLGIVDGGSNRVNPIVMGGLQLEGLVLDFDLGNSMMGFGPKSKAFDIL